MKEIFIKKSKVADTRTCDYTKVTKDELLDASIQHIEDVKKGMEFLSSKLVEASKKHDHTKISGISDFYCDFKNGFKTTSWWDNHRKVERHHLSEKDGIPGDVDIVDVIEFLVDCVMAGLARSGKYRKEKLPTGLLEKAFNNTVIKLTKIVKVVENLPKEKQK